MCCSDDFTCDCGQPGYNPDVSLIGRVDKPQRGWAGKPPVPIDGDNWPLDFAAKTLGISEKDLRDLVRILGLEPAGTMTWANFKRSGRNPRVYNASKLIKIYTAVQQLTQDL